MKKVLKLILFTSLFSLIYVVSFAQQERELSLLVGQTTAKGELKWVYKPATTYLLNYFVKRNESNYGFDFGLGFFEYTPKEDTFYYLVGAANYGTITYSKYRTYQMTFGVKRNFDLLQDKVSLFLAIDFGLLRTIYDYESKDKYVEEIGGGNVLNGSGGVKAGLSIFLTPSFGFTYFSKSTAYLPVQVDNPTFNKFISHNVGLAYKF